MTLWYLARALGFVALLAFTASTALGALATTAPRTAAGRRDRLVRQLVHRSVAVLGLVALTLHAGAIVADSFVDVSIPASLVPFTAGYRPFAVGLGTLGLWAIVAAAVSGASRGRLAGSATAARGWRVVHRLAYVGWALSMGHGVLAGTDTRQPWAVVTYAACAVAVGAAWTWSRVRHQPRRTSSPTTHPQLVRTGAR